MKRKFVDIGEIQPLPRRIQRNTGMAGDGEFLESSRGIESHTSSCQASTEGEEKEVGHESQAEVKGCERECEMLEEGARSKGARDER